ncbi:hypothetical protein VYU27_001085 [Nannochloropsis oceanica]
MRIDTAEEVEALLNDADGDVAACSADRLFNQAVTHHEAGEWGLALRGFSTVLRLEPGRADAAFNIATILQMLGFTRLAVDYTEKTLALRSNDATAHIFLGTVLAATERDAVIEAYRRLVVDGASPNPRALHRLAVLTGEGPSTLAAAPDYVRDVFDELADTFEEKLVSHLSYRVPWDLYEAVHDVVCPPPLEGGWRVMDLGSGTGLCGRIFREYVWGISDIDGSEARAKRESTTTVLAPSGGAMLGCDLSRKMVAKARESGDYTEVRVQEMHEALRQEKAGSLNMILSADTFIYVGQLDECFALVSQALRKGGLFAFSIEELMEKGRGRDGQRLAAAINTTALSPSSAKHEEDTAMVPEFCLMSSGRYAQTHAYILRLLAAYGLELRAYVEVQIRKESTIPVPGKIYVAEKPGA